MPALALAIEIADAARDADILANVEATAEQLRNAHPEAHVEHEDVVAALTIAAGGSKLGNGDDDAHFLPVTVRVGRTVHKIANLREAHEFLRYWPTERQGPVFICAERSCHAAAVGDMPIEQARKSFEGFATIVGILVDSGKNRATEPTEHLPPEQLPLERGIQ